MGGSGGSSGKSDWPTYMTVWHSARLVEMDTLIPTTNPYLGIIAYNPSTPLSALATALSNFVGYYTSVGLTLTAFKSMWSGWVTTVTSGITAALVAAVDVNAVPQFEGGMRDINAVQTSSFVLGKAMIYARIGVEAAGLALQNANQAAQLTMQYGENLRGQFAAQIDYSKVTIIALKEQAEKQIELDIEEAKWPFFEFREAGALLGSIGGPGGLQTPSKPNAISSALGGATTGMMAGMMAGAAYGGSMTGPFALYGAAIGAVVGGIGGYLSSQ